MKQFFFTITVLLFFCSVFYSCIPSQPTPQKSPEMAEPVTPSVPNPPPQNPPEQTSA